MSAQHTPGPWHTAGDQGVQIRSQRDQIAKVWTMRGNEWKANARLIAAAPELLEALQWLVDLMPDPELDNDAVQRAQVIKARATIAKATNPD